jgi:hypothetical protein
MNKEFALFVVITLLLSSLSVSILLNDNTVKADPFSGGAGTEASPYEISNWTHLYNTHLYLDKNFTLVADLNSTTAGYDIYASSSSNGGKGWCPIGTQSNRFYGSFNGNNKSISDLFINRTDGVDGGVGLFGYVGSDVNDSVIETIVNLSLINVNITGNYYVGGLVGTIKYSNNIIGCSVSGSVSGSGINIGGLVGYSKNIAYIDCYSSCTVTNNQTGHVGGLIGNVDNSVIDSCYVTGNITGNSGVGGLAGYFTESSINNSYTYVNVTSIGGSPQNFGGLIGYSIDSNITNTYSKGSVVGNNVVGGLVAQSVNSVIINSYSESSVTCDSSVGGGLVGVVVTSEVINSYSVGNVSGSVLVGGFIGIYINEGDYIPTKMGNITNCYSTGNVSGISCVGGFIGSNYDNNSMGLGNYSGTNITSCFFDNQTSNQTVGIGKVNITQHENVTGKNTEDMKTLSTFDNAGWDIEYSSADLNDGYPYLGWQLNSTDSTWYIHEAFPIIFNPSVTNNSVNVSTRFIWNVSIEHIDGKTFNWTINVSNGQSNSSNNENNGTKNITLSLDWESEYKVWVNATDGENTTKRWFTFTTQDLFFLSNIQPKNNSINQIPNNWSVDINSNNGSFNWSIECSNGQENSSNLDSNGTKIIDLTDLINTTIYTIWLNITAGSESISRTYHFTTYINSIYVWNASSESWRNPYKVKTLNEAITNITNNGTIYIWNGTYNSLTINKSVDILGNSTDVNISYINIENMSTINMSRLSSIGFLIVNSSYIKVEECYTEMLDLQNSSNITINNSVIVNESSGIGVIGGSNHTISNNTISGNSTCFASKNNKIRDNTINGYINISNSTSIEIKNNNLASNTTSIQVDNCQYINCSYNDITGSYGIYVLDSSDTDHFHNNITTNNQGIYISTSPSPLSNHTIMHNNIDGFDETGILIEEENNVTIGYNNISSSSAEGTGILIFWSNNTITHNNRISSFYGIGCAGNYEPGGGGPPISYHRIENNTITFNGVEIFPITISRGLHFYHEHIINISYNVIKEYFTGIQISYSAEFIINHNYIIDNQNGTVLDTCSDGLIYNNWFENEVNNACTCDCSSNIRWNVTKREGVNIVDGPYIFGNYWHDYTGVDTDGDWIGNSVYNLPECCGVMGD